MCANLRGRLLANEDDLGAKKGVRAEYRFEGKGGCGRRARKEVLKTFEKDDGLMEDRVRKTP